MQDPEDLEKALEENLEATDEETQFELEFYSKVAGTKYFQVLNLPDEEGYTPSKKELDVIKEQVNSAGMDLIYRVSVGSHAVVLGPRSGLVGIVPENNVNGFKC